MHKIKQTSPLRWLFVILLLYTAASHATTVVQNGDFESGTLAPWYQGSGTLDYPHDEFWNVSASRVFTGTYSVTNVGNNELRQDFSPIAANLVTEISFNILKETAALDSAIQLHYSDGTLDQLTVSSTGTDIWEHIDVTAALDTTKSLSGISFFGIRSSDPGGIRLYLDDVRIIATPLPAAIWLFGGGLAGLAGVARIRNKG